MEYTDVLYHTELRWLSQGKVLDRCLELREKICQFLQSKGEDTKFHEPKFLCESAFMCHIMSDVDEPAASGPISSSQVRFYLYSPTSQFTIT